MAVTKAPKRLRFFEKHSGKIKKDLSNMDIVHKSSKGINVVIKFKDKFERERIINYCDFIFVYTPI